MKFDLLSGPKSVIIFVAFELRNLLLFLDYDRIKLSFFNTVEDLLFSDVFLSFNFARY